MPTMDELTTTGPELASFIRQLFNVLVDGPILTDEQKTLAASGIACAVCDSRVMTVHSAYNIVRRERMASGLPLGYKGPA